MWIFLRVSVVAVVVVCCRVVTSSLTSTSLDEGGRIVLDVRDYYNDKTTVVVPPSDKKHQLHNNNNNKSLVLMVSLWDNTTTSSTIVHVQCFFVGRNDDDDDDGEAIIAKQQRQKCCDALDNSLSSFQWRPQQLPLQQQQRTMATCYQEIYTSGLPPAAEGRAASQQEHRKEHLHQQQVGTNQDYKDDRDSFSSGLLPRLLWVTELSRSSPRTIDNVGGERDDDSYSSEWRHYLWDEQESMGSWMATMDDEISLLSSSAKAFSSNDTTPRTTTTMNSTPLLQRFLSRFRVVPQKQPTAPAPPLAEVESAPNLKNRQIRIVSDIHHPLVKHNKNNNIQLMSALSEAGGMHRRWHHELQIELCNDTCSGIIDSNPGCPRGGGICCSFAIWIVMHIPSGLFINVEDAFEIQTNPPPTTTTGSVPPQSQQSPTTGRVVSLTIDLLTNDNIVIDQEEPSFSSPPHTVVYRVNAVWDAPNTRSTAEGGSSNQMPLVAVGRVQWDTLLHVRYPKPLPSSSSWFFSGKDTSLSSSSSSFISLVPPQIIMATLGRREEMVGRRQPLVFLTPVMDDAPIRFSIAAGYASDLIPVLIVTLAMTWIGTVLLLRGMAQLTD